MRSTAFIFLMALFINASGCRRALKVDEEAVLAVVRENVAAMQREDLAGLMATIHSESPAASATGEKVAELFEQTNLRYTLSNLKLVSAADGEARVSFTQRTESADADPETRANTISGLHVLRLENGQWKIFSTPSVRIEKLEP